jgi:hypothetical protein
MEYKTIRAIVFEDLERQVGLYIDDGWLNIGQPSIDGNGLWAQAICKVA